MTADPTGGTDHVGSSCGGSSDGGAPDRVYYVDVPAGGADIIATAQPTNPAGDGRDVILTTDASCGGLILDCSDSPMAAATETVAVIDAAPGRYYVIVDGF